jgi:hypothetical protein
VTDEKKNESLTFFLTPATIEHQNTKVRIREGTACVATNANVNFARNL